MTSVEDKQQLVPAENTEETKPRPTGCAAGSFLFSINILALICFATVGSYYAYDAVGALETDILDRMDINKFEFGILYSIYSLPNIVMVFVGGVFTDKVGQRTASLLFSFLCVAGACIVALGPQLKIYWIMVAGRFLFGIGAESLCVCQDSMTNRHFRDSGWLAIAYGILVTVSRLGTLFTFWVEPRISDASSVTVALWVAAGVCVLSWLTTVLYTVFDRVAEKKLGLAVAEEMAEEIHISDVKTFPKTYWIVLLLCAVFYAAVMPFIAIGTDFFHESYHKSKTTAGEINSIVIMSSIILSPIMGALVDRFGMRSICVCVGTALLLPTHIVMGYCHSVNPIIPMALLGAAFSLVPSALWPSVSILIQPSQVGTAFGLIYCVQNGFLSAANLSMGAIISKWGYTTAMFTFFCLDCFGFILGILLVIADFTSGRKLHRREIEKWDAEDESTKLLTDDGKETVEKKEEYVVSS
eukprot:GCRY01000319.1.p1 GENE.GCRY01000319.1~~GCRY01000319.1.p1  ORF type:complete len:470 (+),score=130.51 GCRY01000319.1:172-1581(+)